MFRIHIEISEKYFMRQKNLKDVSAFDPKLFYSRMMLSVINNNT